MNRFTFFIDIAGRLSLDVAGNPRVTASAVVLGSGQLEIVRSRLSKVLPKWKACTQKDAEAIVNLLVEESVAVGIFSINKDTAEWRQFWKDAQPLHSAIVAQDKKSAGFVKPANVFAFMMIGSVCAIGSGHALRISPKKRIQDYRGLDLIERTIVCDSEINGAENLDVFRGLWERHDNWQPRLEEAGIRMTTAEVHVTTEQQEPLLFLADYAAGIAHAALLPNPGRIPLPLSFSEATTQQTTQKCQGPAKSRRPFCIWRAGQDELGTGSRLFWRPESPETTLCCLSRLRSVPLRNSLYGQYV